MGQASKIEWTDATWTPIRARRADGKMGVHCEKVSPACANCYAERLNMRNLPAHGTGLAFGIANRDKVEIITDEKILLQPLSWKRGRRIFVCSQTDLFGEFVDDDQIALVFAVMAITQHHTFQVLTKRADRMQNLLSSEMFWDLVDGLMTGIIDSRVDPLHRKRDDLRATAPEVGPSDPAPNIWLGVTAETQEWADKRIPELAKTPAAKRFLSLEPLLGPVLLYNWIGTTAIDWVIAGGESGPGARPMHPDWIQDVQDQCVASGIPFFFKQWGEWAPGTGSNAFVPIDGLLKHGGHTNYYGTLTAAGNKQTPRNWAQVQRIGKSRAGRLLDGREWNEVPE